MDVTDRCPLKDEFTERAVVRSITEAARDNRHNLSSRRGYSRGKRHKGRVQIHRLDADTAQGKPVC